MQKKKKGHQPSITKTNNPLSYNEAHPLQREQAAVLHVGPLPDPATLSSYNQLIQNGADRIMAMAEKEQECSHKLRLEGIAITACDNKAYYQGVIRGQWISLISSIIMTGAALFLANVGHLKLAALFVSGPLVVILKTLWNPNQTPLFPPISRNKEKGGN